MTGKGAQANLDPWKKEKPIWGLFGRENILENLVVYWSREQSKEYLRGVPLWHDGVSSISAAPGLGFNPSLAQWAKESNVCCSYGVGENCGLDLIPGLGTPYAPGRPKMNKKFFFQSNKLSQLIIITIIIVIVTIIIKRRLPVRTAKEKWSGLVKCWHSENHSWSPGSTIWREERGEVALWSGGWLPPWCRGHDLVSREDPQNRTTVDGCSQPSWSLQQLILQLHV